MGKRADVPTAGLKLGVAALCFAAALGLGACSPLPTAFHLPQHNVPAIGASGVATGGTIRFDGRCVWLEHDGGGSANLLWPAGFSAVAPPLQIRGTSGRVIIRENDLVELGVSEAVVGVPGCPARGTWLVGEVSKVGDTEWPDGQQARPERTTGPQVK